MKKGSKMMAKVVAGALVVSFAFGSASFGFTTYADDDIESVFVGDYNDEEDYDDYELVMVSTTYSGDSLSDDPVAIRIPGSGGGGGGGNGFGTDGVVRNTINGSMVRNEIREIGMISNELREIGYDVDTVYIAITPPCQNKVHVVVDKFALKRLINAEMDFVIQTPTFDIEFSLDDLIELSKRTCGNGIYITVTPARGTTAPNPFKLMVKDKAGDVIYVGDIR